MPDRNYAWKLANEANARLAERDPKRAEEIEWYVDNYGYLKLRDRPEWSARQKLWMDRKQETERQDWKRKHEAGQFSQGVPINETMDF